MLSVTPICPSSARTSASASNLPARTNACPENTAIGVASVTFNEPLFHRLRPRSRPRLQPRAGARRAREVRFRVHPRADRARHLGAHRRRLRRDSHRPQRLPVGPGAGHEGDHLGRARTTNATTRRVAGNASATATMSRASTLRDRANRSTSSAVWPSRSCCCRRHAKSRSRRRSQAKRGTANR